MGVSGGEGLIGLGAPQIWEGGVWVVPGRGCEQRNFPFV